MTCNECRWKVERKEYSWNFDYDEEEVDYAEDCIDFRDIDFSYTAFKTNT